MITVLFADNQEKIKEILLKLLSKEGDVQIGMIKQENMVRIMENNSVKDMVSLKDKIIELEDFLIAEKKGLLYKSILEAIEKPLLEHILGRTDGNQLKAAKILGINRNTIRAKIKKLGISPEMYKK